MVAVEMTKQLQAINFQFSNSTDEEECAFFMQSQLSWVVGITGGARSSASSDSGLFLLNLFVEPVRCDDFFPLYDGSATKSFCRYFDVGYSSPNLTAFEAERISIMCEVWGSTNSSSTVTELSALADLRTGAISVQVESREGFLITKDGNVSTTFRVTASYNQTDSVDSAYVSSNQGSSICSHALLTHCDILYTGHFYLFYCKFAFSYVLWVGYLCSGETLVC
jgi:hypothetical protein